MIEKLIPFLKIYLLTLVILAIGLLLDVFGEREMDVFGKKMSTEELLYKYIGMTKVYTFVYFLLIACWIWMKRCRCCCVVYKYIRFGQKCTPSNLYIHFDLIDQLLDLALSLNFTSLVEILRRESNSLPSVSLSRTIKATTWITVTGIVTQAIMPASFAAQTIRSSIVDSPFFIQITILGDDFNLMASQI